MRHPQPPIAPARAALVLALASGLLGGCAEMHRGVEAVGRIGSPAAPAEAAEAAPPGRPDVKTVRPRGAPRAPAADVSDAAPAPAVVASAVPSPRQIFDFHPAGSRPDGWRQPFLIDTNDGPLAADVRRSSAELRTFLAAQKAGTARAAQRDAGQPAKADGLAAGATRKVCGEMDVATAKPGCGVPRPQAAAVPVP